MGEVRKWKPRPRSLTVQEAAAAVRRLDALQAELPTLSGSIEAVRRDVAGNTERTEKWSFIMVGPKENAVVLDRISREARRPKISIRLWGAMLCRLTETGEIKMTRKDMMEAAETATSGHISVALGELQEWGALIREEESRTIVRWFINPRAATRLAEHARPWAQKDAPNIVQLHEARQKEKAARTARPPNKAATGQEEGRTDAASTTIHDERQHPLIE